MYPNGPINPNDLIMSSYVGAGGYFRWKAVPGQEIIERSGAKIIEILCDGGPNGQILEVYRNPQDGMVYCTASQATFIYAHGAMRGRPVVENPCAPMEDTRDYLEAVGGC